MKNKNDWANIPDPDEEEPLMASKSSKKNLDPEAVPDAMYDPTRPIVADLDEEPGEDDLEAPVAMPAGVLPLEKRHAPVVAAVMLNLAFSGRLKDRRSNAVLTSRAAEIQAAYTAYVEKEKN